VTANIKQGDNSAVDKHLARPEDVKLSGSSVSDIAFTRVHLGDVVLGVLLRWKLSDINISVRDLREAWEYSIKL